MNIKFILFGFYLLKVNMVRLRMAGTLTLALMVPPVTHGRTFLLGISPFLNVVEVRLAMGIE